MTKDETIGTLLNSFTPCELADAMRVPIETVNDWIGQKTVRAYMVGDRMIIPEEGLLKHPDDILTGI